MRCCVYADVGLHIFSKTQPRDIPSSRKEHSLFDRTVESILTRMLHAAVPAVFNVQCCSGLALVVPGPSETVLGSMGNAQGSNGGGFNEEAGGFGPGIVPTPMTFAPQPVPPPTATRSEHTAPATAAANGASQAASTSAASQPAATFTPAPAPAPAPTPAPVGASPEGRTSLSSVSVSAPSNAASTTATGPAPAAAMQPSSPKAQQQQGLRLSIPSGPLPTAAAQQSATRPATARPPKLKARGGAGLSLSLSLPAGGLPDVPAGAMTARRDGFALNLGPTEAAALSGADVTADGILITEQHRKEFKLARMALVRGAVGASLVVASSLQELRLTPARVFRWLPPSTRDSL